MTAVQRCGKKMLIFLEFHNKLIEDGYGKGKREPMNQSKREILIQESLNQPFDGQ